MRIDLIGDPYSRKYRRAIVESRTETAEGVARLLKRCGNPCYYHGFEHDFLSSLSHFALFLSWFSFPSRCPYVGIFLSFGLLRPCSSYLFLSSTYRYSAINSNRSRVLASRVSVSFQIFLPFLMSVCSYFLVCGLACVVSTYPARWHLAWVAHPYQVPGMRFFCLSVSVL